MYNFYGKPIDCQEKTLKVQQLIVSFKAVCKNHCIKIYLHYNVKYIYMYQQLLLGCFLFWVYKYTVVE